MSRLPPYRGHAVRRERENLVPVALAALSIGELRAFAADALDRLDDGPRGELEDLLLQRAAQSASGWRPPAPQGAVVAEVRAFLAAARRDPSVDPAEVDRFLRLAIQAAVAGDFGVAHAIFELILTPIDACDLDLGEHECVDEVLSVDLGECARQFAVSAYMTSAPEHRVAAVFHAVDLCDRLHAGSDPIEAIAAALPADAASFDEFLDGWIDHLTPMLDGSHSQSWRWAPSLHTATLRRHGIEGLARLVRSTRDARTADAWCDAFVTAGDWEAALLANEECAQLVDAGWARGRFLDGAACAALALGRDDLTQRLEAAWCGAPSLPRMTRWLLAGEPSVATVFERARAAAAFVAPGQNGLAALLEVLQSDVASAAQRLAQAPGLGWSLPDHPGHLIFGVFAWLLGGEPQPSVRHRLCRALHGADADDPDRGLAEPASSCLPDVRVIEVLRRVDPGARITAPQRATMQAALRDAAIRRTEAVIAEKRRRHYEHAALLVACCVELEAGSATNHAAIAWASELRRRTARYPAFQAALRAAEQLSCVA